MAAKPHDNDFFLESCGSFPLFVLSALSWLLFPRLAPRLVWRLRDQQIFQPETFERQAGGLADMPGPGAF